MASADQDDAMEASEEESLDFRMLDDESEDALCFESNSPREDTSEGTPERARNEEIEQQPQCIPGYRWNYAAVDLMIAEYRNRQEDFTSGRKYVKHLWQAISRVMRQNGYNVTGVQCKTKFKGMKRIYRMIENDERSGKAPSNWPYLGMMNNLMGDPGIAVTTVTSKPPQGRRRESEESEALSESESDEYIDDAFLDQWNEVMTRNNAARAEQHKVLLEQKKQALELLRRLVDAVKNEKNSAINIDNLANED